MRSRGVLSELDRPEITRTVIECLAWMHAEKVRLAGELSGSDVRIIHSVGGGSRNPVSCQLTSNFSGLPAIAGPAEAAATGNVLVQARAHRRQKESIGSLRAKVRSTFSFIRYEPVVSPRVAAAQGRNL